ncbi:hypothetical protein SO694_0007715 [Aureococcus anophagefferens]|uniref:Uncharacterized protein n=1 Tax=Aureococcus anophagefferens TaxID=44056 RepID=A0ABR1FHR3_AURAN
MALMTSGSAPAASSSDESRTPSASPRPVLEDLVVGRRRVAGLRELPLRGARGALRRGLVRERLGRKRVRNSQLWRLLSRSFSTRFG